MHNNIVPLIDTVLFLRELVLFSFFFGQRIGFIFKKD
jgi:hypothetical protein